MRKNLCFILCITAASLNASAMDQILNELSQRREALHSVHIAYHGTVEQFKQENQTALAGESPRPHPSAHRTTTFTVSYTRQGDRSHFVREKCDADGECTHQDVTWTDNRTSAATNATHDAQTHSFLDSPPGAPEDISTLELLEYWMYIGITPKWINLEDGYDIELNIPRHYTNNVTAVSDDDLTTLTFQGRYAYTFDGFQLVKKERLAGKDGPVMLRVSFTYNQKIGTSFPAQIVAEAFDSSGNIEVKKTITVTELTTNVSFEPTLRTTE